MCDVRVDCDDGTGCSCPAEVALCLGTDCEGLQGLTASVSEREERRDGREREEGRDNGEREEGRDGGEREGGEGRWRERGGE